jgi:hypothetical protein
MLDRFATSLSREAPRLLGLRSRRREHKPQKTARRPAVEALEGRLLLSVETASQRLSSFLPQGPIKGLCYTPEPSDDPTPPPVQYFDSDFWNNNFTPMWSSQKNIPGFTTSGNSVNGRGDLATFQSLGVNFLHLYDWNPQRNHGSFLAAAAADGMTVNVPISNYVFTLLMVSSSSETQLQFVQQVFQQVYPNLQSRNTAPAAGISMWTIGNEPDNSGGQITPQEVAEVAQMIVYCETQAGIPDANQLPIAVPLSWATSYGGTSFSNPTPSVGAVEALYAAFVQANSGSSSFSATEVGGSSVTVGPLPSNFFTTRFVWANNPIGNQQVNFFLGVNSPHNIPPWPAYNQPQNTDEPINWTQVPMFFTELGPSSLGNSVAQQKLQAKILAAQLADVKRAESGGNDTNFYGATVFQFLDQIAHKSGPEAHFGIETFNTAKGYQPITDSVSPPGGGSTWRLDYLQTKLAFATVMNAFTPPHNSAAAVHHRLHHFGKGGK